MIPFFFFCNGIRGNPIRSPSLCAVFKACHHGFKHNSHTILLIRIQLLSQGGPRTAQTITQLQQVQAVRSAIQPNLARKAILLKILVAIERNPGGPTSAKHYALIDLLARHNIPQDLIPELRLSNLYNTPYTRLTE